MKTFVGFGFGPIQAGLFLTEAFRSGNFDRLVVAEVLPDVVAAVGKAGAFTVNIGYADHIEALTVAPLEIYRPQVPADRQALVAAVAAADELATAVPSVNHYTMGGADSIAALLAEGLRAKAAGKGPLAVVYAAENHTQAAELLAAAVMAQIPAAEQAAVARRVQFLDTIIGKMSGAPEASTDLAPVAPGLQRAFLVESFNRILVDQLRRPGERASQDLDPGWADYQPGIEVFIAKADLRPFAAAKLYGHNAGHALAGYLAQLLGCTRIDELCARPDVIDCVRQAMIQESGLPLCRRYAGVDPLFTPAGFRAYAEDLIVRMLNPYVRDTVARVRARPGAQAGVGRPPGGGHTVGIGRGRDAPALWLGGCGRPEGPGCHARWNTRLPGRPLDRCTGSHGRAGDCAGADCRRAIRGGGVGQPWIP